MSLLSHAQLRDLGRKFRQLHEGAKKELEERAVEMGELKKKLEEAQAAPPEPPSAPPPPPTSEESDKSKVSVVYGRVSSFPYAHVLHCRSWKRPGQLLRD